MGSSKGEEFLKKLVQQELFLTRDLRQLTDALAKGKVALAFGIGRSQAEPFVKAGLPIKPAPAPREGLPASNSFGVLGIVKDPPHPNATKIFINWFPSREGQDWYGRVMQNGSRRLTWTRNGSKHWVWMQQKIRLPSRNIIGCAIVSKTNTLKSGYQRENSLKPSSNRRCSESAAVTAMIEFLRRGPRVAY